MSLQPPPLAPPFAPLRDLPSAMRPHYLSQAGAHASLAPSKSAYPRTPSATPTPSTTPSLSLHPSIDRNVAAPPARQIATRCPPDSRQLSQTLPVVSHSHRAAHPELGRNRVAAASQPALQPSWLRPSAPPHPPEWDTPTVGCRPEPPSLQRAAVLERQFVIDAPLVRSGPVKGLCDAPCAPARPDYPSRPKATVAHRSYESVTQTRPRTSAHKEIQPGTAIITNHSRSRRCPAPGSPRGRYHYFTPRRLAHGPDLQLARATGPPRTTNGVGAPRQRSS